MATRWSANLILGNAAIKNRSTSVVPFLLCCRTDGGGVATFIASP